MVVVADDPPKRRSDCCEAEETVFNASEVEWEALWERGRETVFNASEVESEGLWEWGRGVSRRKLWRSGRMWSASRRREMEGERRR